MTTSWEQAFPHELRRIFKFAETRDAAAILKATEPEAFDDIVSVLNDFFIDVDFLYRPGGNRSKMAEMLDEAFRLRGWREARYSQELSTTLTVFPWKDASTPETTEQVTAVMDAEGHKIDNVKGRAMVDVEWNPKDGNLDRDISNYVALYNGGLINVGVLIVRSDSFREKAVELFEDIRNIAVKVPNEVKTINWVYRDSVSRNPYETTTTANFEKAVPRLRRGDGQGCPVLVIGIGWESFRHPETSLENEILRLAQSTETPVVPKSRYKEFEKKWQDLSGAPSEKATITSTDE